PVQPGGILLVLARATRATISIPHSAGRPGFLCGGTCLPYTYVDARGTRVGLAGRGADHSRLNCRSNTQSRGSFPLSPPKTSVKQFVSYKKNSYFFSVFVVFKNTPMLTYYQVLPYSPLIPRPLLSRFPQSFLAKLQRRFFKE